MKKVYIVYDGDGMEVFTTMKDAIAYAIGDQDVYTDGYTGERISMTSIRRDLKDWIQVSGSAGQLGHFTITPTVLHKRGSVA